MRTLRWVFLVACVGLVAIGCCGTGRYANGTTPDPTPRPTPGPTPAITAFSAPVIGFAGTADMEFVAAGTGGSVLATGTLVAAESRFTAEFVPLSDVPADLLQPGPDLGDVNCDIDVVPNTLRTAVIWLFVQADAPEELGSAIGMLQLADYDPWEDDEPIGSRFYTFWLADQAGSITGTCIVDGGDVAIDMGISLTVGWNPVAVVITAVESGDRSALRLQNETPIAAARWYYPPWAVIPD